MFIADTTRLLRTSMGGTQLLLLVNEVVYRASGITLDLIAQRVYWCDSLLDYIETVDYEGKNRFPVVRGMIFYSIDAECV